MPSSILQQIKCAEGRVSSLERAIKVERRHSDIKVKKV